MALGMRDGKIKLYNYVSSESVHQFPAGNCYIFLKRIGEPKAIFRYIVKVYLLERIHASNPTDIF